MGSRVAAFRLLVMPTGTSRNPSLYHGLAACQCRWTLKGNFLPRSPKTLSLCESRFAASQGHHHVWFSCSSERLFSVVRFCELVMCAGPCDSPKARFVCVSSHVGLGRPNVVRDSPKRCQKQRFLISLACLASPFRTGWSPTTLSSTDPAQRHQGSRGAVGVTKYCSNLSRMSGSQRRSFTPSHFVLKMSDRGGRWVRACAEAVRRVSARPLGASNRHLATRDAGCDANFIERGLVHCTVGTEVPFRPLRFGQVSSAVCTGQKR